MPVILREGLKQARKKVLTILEKIHGKVRLPHSPQIKDRKIVHFGVRAASSLFLGGEGMFAVPFYSFSLSPPLPGAYNKPDSFRLCLLYTG